jgi:two-component sensor histidine kinase
LALTEATTNAVRHAFPGTGGQFVVDGWVRGPMLILSVCDRAAGLTQLSPARGLGLGRPIITRLAESVDFEDADPGTRVTMRFRRHRHP